MTAAAAPLEAPVVNKWMITLTIMTGAIMSALDTSIVNVALPYMRGNLGASVEEITWVATAYILSSVIMMPIVALLSARFGRKNLFMGSVLLFTLTSMLCGLAWDLPSMVVFRTLQGIGGGALMPISLAILRESFPPEEHGMAMGLFGLGVVLGPAFGPTLGGWLTDHFAWPWIFYINVPVGLVNLLLVARYIHDPDYLVREKGRLDLAGLALLVIGLGALQLMLEKGETENWFSSDLIVVLAAVATVGLLLFVWRELTVERPAVNLRLLKDMTFASGTLIGGALGIGLYASLFLLPFFLQQLLGYSAFDAGLALMPRSAAMALAMPIAGRLYNRLGPRTLIVTGLLIDVYSFWELSRLSLDVGFWDIFFPQLWQGIGFGFIFVALSTVTLSSMKKAQMTAASGLYQVVRYVCGSIGIALAATGLTHGEATYHSLLSEQLSAGSTALQQWLQPLTALFYGNGSDLPTARLQAWSLLDGNLARQASMLSFNHIFGLFTLLFLFCLPLVLLLRAKGGTPPVEEIIID
jgi:MFS transporter, DHA2 family, multidrug resistance protein